MGSGNVLVKGGHLGGDPTDVLFDGRDFLCLEAQRIATGNTHGTGCTLSSAIASNMAGGKSIAEAVMEAKRYVTGAIENALPMGKGAGPLNHFFRLYSTEGTKDL
jgi:hydroxymethylpyrimidine/phosphomethylpyrimidine kinase